MLTILGLEPPTGDRTLRLDDYVRAKTGGPGVTGTSIDTARGQRQSAATMPFAGRGSLFPRLDASVLVFRSINEDVLWPN